MVIFAEYFGSISGNTMKEIVIASFYKFVSLANYESLREPLLAKMQEHLIKGTIILAAEGINGSFAGTRENMDNFYQVIRADERLADLRFKETFDKDNPFEKSKVKLRKEIVTMGIKNVDPLKTVGTYLDPQEWNELIKDPEVVLIDTRNDYEFELGTFKNAINPNTENFRNFPEYVEHHLLDKKDKRIAMFCTGGIRCEKSGLYMREIGMEHSYQLEGGILKYFEEVGSAHYQGSCFVFDTREALEPTLDSIPLDRSTRKKIKTS